MDQRGRSVFLLFTCLLILVLLLSACGSGAASQTAPETQPTTAAGVSGKATRTPFPTRRPPAGTRTPTIDPSAQPVESETPAGGETPGVGETPSGGETPAGDAAITISFGDALNVRRGPGLAYDIVAAFQLGQTAEAHGRDANGEWLQVEVPGSSGVYGWVYAKATTVVVSGDAQTLPEATFNDPVPAYVRNCTSHQIALRPGEIILEPLVQQPANRQQVNPGFYEVVDLTLDAASVTTLSVTEGGELTVTQDGDGVNYTCPR